MYSSNRGSHMFSCTRRPSSQSWDQQCKHHETQLKKNTQESCNWPLASSVGLETSSPCCCSLSKRRETLPHQRLRSGKLPHTQIPIAFPYYMKPPGIHPECPERSTDHRRRQGMPWRASCSKALTVCIMDRGCRKCPLIRCFGDILLQKHTMVPGVPAFQYHYSFQKEGSRTQSLCMNCQYTAEKS